MSFERVVRSSPRAVRGVVVRSRSAWDADRNAIWTHYDIRVSETLRGPTGAIFTISEPGGRVDDLEMRVPGAPRFSVGEEAVIFAYPTPLGYWRVRGWGQGRFRVERGDGAAVVRLPARPTGPTRPDEARKNRAATLAPRDREQLDSFLERARTLIGLEEGR